MSDDPQASPLSPELEKACKLHGAGKLEAAQQIYNHLLREGSKDPLLHHLSELAHLQVGGWPQDIPYLDKVLLDLRDPWRLCMAIGRTLNRAKRFEKAEIFLRKALEVKASDPEVLVDLGNTFLGRERLEEAISLYSQAIQLAPDFPRAHFQLANVYYGENRFDLAEKSFRKTLDLQPDHFLALCNLGTTMVKMARIEEALSAFEYALALQPNNHSIRGKTALGLLALGDLPKGWALYESAMLSGDRSPPRVFDAPRWQGEDLTGKSILVWREQGIGDEIVFSSCFPDIVDMAGRCIIEATDRLIPLFARSFPLAEFVAAGQELPKTDFQIPAGSLPRFFRPFVEAYPTESSYLHPNSLDISQWKERLNDLGEGLKVGIAWRSSLRNLDRNHSYCAVGDLARVFAVPGVIFVNLQYDDCADELEEVRRSFGVEVVSFSDLDLRNDLDKTAALTAALDLVISVGISVADMAGAVGTECWSAIQARHAFMLGTKNYPWFPTMRVFEKQWNQSWPMVFDDIAVELEKRV